jgi:hypothetical protein
MKAKFEWEEQEIGLVIGGVVNGKIFVTDSDQEEMARFFTQFKESMRKTDLLISMEHKEGTNKSAHYLIRAFYTDTEYYREKLHYNSLEEFIALVENRINNILQYEDYSKDTNTTLMDAIVTKLKEESLYDKFQAIEEYYMPATTDAAFTNLEYYELISYVNDGSEGTWLNVFLSGELVDGEQRKIPMGTFKTLKDDLNAALIMGELGGAIYYIGNKYINKNYDRLFRNKR